MAGAGRGGGAGRPRGGGGAGGPSATRARPPRGLGRGSGQGYPVMPIASLAPSLQPSWLTFVPANRPVRMDQRLVQMRWRSVLTCCQDM